MRAQKACEVTALGPIREARAECALRMRRSVSPVSRILAVTTHQGYQLELLQTVDTLLHRLAYPFSLLVCDAIRSVVQHQRDGYA